MAVKTSFEPKDARVTTDRKYFSNDIPRKRITGTQALVEFLNTTSPEEFKKTTVLPTRRSSSALFFKRGLNKSKSSTPSTPLTTPMLVHRKNYIEIIIAHPFTSNSSEEATSQETITTNLKNRASFSTLSLSSSTRQSRKKQPSQIAIWGSQLDHTLSNSSASIYSINHPPLAANKPILPIRNSNNLFTVTTSPVTNDSATTTSERATAARSKLTTTTNRRQMPSLRIASTVQHDDQCIPLDSTPRSSLIKDEEDSIIEEGLQQRLNYYQSLLQEKPSDTLSKRLAHEHMAALQVSSMMDETTRRKKKKNKTSARHIQVQTMVPYPDNSIEEEEEKQKEDDKEVNTAQVDELKQRLERVEKELKQEKLVSARLQAALEETRDQCEMLSGLAYKKLREVWEEKTRWENACIETKERCWHDHQQQILGDIVEEGIKEEDDSSMMDFFMVDDDQELQSGGEEEDLI